MPTPDFWLFKTEPDVFSIDDLASSPGKTACWEGVRNYQARNFMRDQMKKKQLGFLYHSNTKDIGIYGIIEIVKEGYPDKFAFDPDHKYFDPKSKPENPSWYMVDVRLVKKFKKPVLLKEMKDYSELRNMTLLQKGNRLSVMPVSKNEFEFIRNLAE